MVRAIYPGTFDPITLGHQDLVTRAASMFDELILAIADNPGKMPRFNLAQRIELAQQVLAPLPNVRVIGFSGLMIDCAAQYGATVAVRGVRAVADFEFEISLASMNRTLLPTLDTVFLTPSEHFRHVSSSLIKEIAKHGGDVSRFVDPRVADALRS